MPSRSGVPSGGPPMLKFCRFRAMPASKRRRPSSKRSTTSSRSMSKPAIWPNEFKGSIPRRRSFKSAQTAILDIAPDLRGLTVRTSLAQLVGRLDAAEKDQTRRHELAAQQDEREALLVDAEATLKNCQAGLAVLCREAGCDSPRRPPRRRAAVRAERTTWSKKSWPMSAITWPNWQPGRNLDESGRHEGAEAMRPRSPGISKIAEASNWN